MTHPATVLTAGDQRAVSDPSPTEVKALFRAFLDSLGFERMADVTYGTPDWQPQAALSLEGY